MSRMLQFIGESPEDAKVNASKIVALEIALSNPRLDRVERRDARLQYNPMTIADLQKIPNLLLKRGYSQQDCQKIMHGNWLGLLKKTV